MNTENEKPKYPKRIDSEIEFHEKGQWTKGEHIITVMGGLPNAPKQPIGYITLVDYDENKKPILSATDLDGNAFIEPSSNLYAIKKEFKAQEQRLTKAMLILHGTELDEKEQEVPFTAPEEPNVADLTTTRKRSIPRNNSHTISH